MSSHEPQFQPLVRLAVRLTAIAVIAVPSAAAQPSTNGVDQRRWSVADMREDLATFRRDFLGRDQSYGRTARTQAEGALRDLERSLDTISSVRFELTLARIVALADNGHTIAAPGIRAQHYNRVPLRLVPLGTELRVLR